MIARAAALVDGLNLYHGLPVARTSTSKRCSSIAPVSRSDAEHTKRKRASVLAAVPASGFKPRSKPM